MESPGTKPDCKDVFYSVCTQEAKDKFITTFSITFPSVLSHGIGLYFLQSEGSSFLITVVA